jgi:hypothetical protein
MKKRFVSFTIIALLIFFLLSACQAEPVSAPVDQNATLAVLIESLEARLEVTASPQQQVKARIIDFSPGLDIMAGSRATTVRTAFVTLTPTPEPSRSSTAATKPTKKVIEPTRIPPEAWQEWPVIPTLSKSAIKHYRAGEADTYRDVFSIVGDCQSLPWLFLGLYDRNEYILNEGQLHLQETIDFYKGSFNYYGPSVIDGLNVSSALSPDWADKNVCLPDESPLECELRLRRPAIMLVNLGTNWGTSSITRYEKYLRQIVDTILARGVLPVLATKADNVEGDHSINLVIARVAYDYELPLWNFWRAAQSLPNGGLDIYRDNIHLTLDGVNLHSSSALEMLDYLRETLESGE